MDTTYVTAFISATQKVFNTMLQLSVTFGKPVVTQGVPSKFDVSGVIGMSGDITGAVVLSFPTETALGVVKAFTGESVSTDNEDFSDAIGELANMVSGNAKSKFDGKSVSISCPCVIIGSDHKIQQPSESNCISIPCNCACGEFAVEFCILKKTKDAPRVEAKSTTESAR